MLNFPKIPKIALRKFSELSHSVWRSKRAKSTQDSYLLGGSSYYMTLCSKQVTQSTTVIMVVRLVLQCIWKAFSAGTCMDSGFC